MPLLPNKTDMDYPIEKLKEHYLKLPDDVQDAISSVAIAEALQSIGEKHSLHIDQIGSLNNVVGEVMLGITKPDEFAKRLAQELPVPQGTVSLLVQDIDEQIFKPIRASLIKMSAQKTTASEHEPEDITAAQVLREIENPSRVSYTTQPIEVLLPTQTKTAVPLPKPPQVREQLAPETLAELPASFRPNNIAPPEPRTSPIPQMSPIPSMTVMPKATPPLPKTLFVPPTSSDVPPINLPTKESERPIEQKISEQAETMQKSRVDPYREPI